MSTQIVRQISCFGYGIISLQGTGLHNKTLLTERMRLCDCLKIFGRCYISYAMITL